MSRDYLRLVLGFQQKKYLKNYCKKKKAYDLFYEKSKFLID
jgi:hypothetical protein